MIMAHDRITPCKYYICQGSCYKNRNASYSGYCQKCNKYEPRARIKHKNIKKEKLRRENNISRNLDY